VWTNETGRSDVGVTPACGGVEGLVGGVAIFPTPAVWKVCRVPSETAEAPDSRCAVWRLSTPQHNGRGPDSSLKRLCIFVKMQVYMT